MLPTEILEAVPEAIIIFTGDSMKSLELVWLNQTARQMFSQSANKLVGSPIPPNCLVFDRNDQDTVLNALTMRSTLSDTLTDFVDGNGRSISGIISFDPFAFDGRPVQMATMLRGRSFTELKKAVMQTGDIEDKEKQELAIIQTRQQAKEERVRYIEIALKNLELERLHRERDDAIGMVAHDLKNPLSSIHLMLSKLERYRDRMTTEQIHQTVQRTLMTIDSMSDTVSSLVTVHKLESKQEPFNYVNIDVRTVIDDMMMQMQPLADKKQIAINIETVQIAPIIRADPAQLSRVLVNLVSNAIKFSHPNTTITINISQHESRVDISIRDQGQGLTEEDLEAIFSKFGKLSALPTAKEQSTGLGLYISKQLTTAMGGQLKVFSPGRNKGSIFTLTFDTVAAPLS